MKRAPSPTLLQLILIGFLVVALPLIATLITAIARVDDLARDSREAVAAVQKNTATSGQLADRIVEMERTARQFKTLADNTYRDLYRAHRRDVLTMLEELSDSNASNDSGLRARLNRVKSAEIDVNQAVKAIGQGASEEDLETAFATLRNEVLEIVREYTAMTKDMGNAMSQSARRLQHLLIGRAALVIPLSLGLAILFVVLIARPLRQIDQGIRSLGRGSLNESVRVKGTRDLEELGHRLNWLRERLIELEEQKARFLRNVSHELKTPLTNIREGSELLLETKDESGESEQSIIIRIMRDNSVQLQRMIEELLHYGANGDMDAEHIEQTVALDRLVRYVAEDHSSIITARHLTLNLSLMPTNATGNPKKLRVIIGNLLSNAVKYTPQGGRIDIDLNRQEGRVWLDVRDSGPGVDARDKAHIFEWFYTGPRPPESIVSGTGMGLAIAQEYAQQHGGLIRLIESSSGGHFRLELKGSSHDKT